MSCACFHLKFASTILFLSSSSWSSSSSRWFSSTEPYSPPNIRCKGHTSTIKYPAQNSYLEQLVLAAVEALQLLGGGGQVGDLGLEGEPLLGEVGQLRLGNLLNTQRW